MTFFFFLISFDPTYLDQCISFPNKLREQLARLVAWTCVITKGSYLYLPAKGSNPEKKLLPFGHCPKVALTPPPLFWTPVG